MFRKTRPIRPAKSRTASRVAPSNARSAGKITSRRSMLLNNTRIRKGKNALIGIETEKARAVRELDKAEVATREAIDDLKQTSRELMERIEEARAHIGVSSEDDEAAPISVDPFRLRLPLAASFPT
jgi:hypothetical protein